MPPPSPATPLPPAARVRAIMILVTGALFMEILDGTVIATALPAMARSFGTTAVALNIGVSAYLLALGVFVPASGWVVDRFGARRVFAFAIALFTLTSALCGVSNGLVSFVVLRVIQGIAGALMVPVGRLVVMRSTPKERLMAAMQSLIWPALIAPVLGPPVGGFITTHFGWRWIFYLNVPIGLIALVVACFIIPDAREARERRFDWTGFLLSGAGTFTLLTGLERADARLDAMAFAMLAVGIALLIVAIRHLMRARDPLVDLSACSIPTFRAALRGGSLARMAIGSAPFLLPLMFQVGFGYDAFHSGLLVLAVFAGNLAMKSVTTPILQRFGYRPVMIWNGVFCAVCLAACAWLQQDTPVPITVLLLFLSGMTRSMQFTVLGTIAYADVAKERMSDANSLFNTASQIAMAAGITLGALGVRLGHFVALHADWHGSGIEYRVAFVLIGIVALGSIVDAIRLPKGAADHFITRST
ncbi:MAG: DHA2 family efflux MFS transporter permease subunit [Paraburkholderia tropica]|nr:DHA2 family efflux MFS transporter permease subunit [Paraburkholderia tropica]MBB3005248.1 EmrB/QacA subfamily drug resistance transporter [Paraburkholderia tropica]MBB6324197.1 EmrB/QacA subfamily drug resistance transporter [Paraburkholderia tropica]MDE1140410.1 DHA2 family efflux MFS transporter permease subunit [Paraburkholderia tropica]RQN35304.1 DHA2 family efflux MFS transporter permease subunit [Paraburkholderia tropica]